MWEKKLLSVFHQKRGFEVLLLPLGKIAESKADFLSFQSPMFAYHQSYLLESHATQWKNAYGTFQSFFLPASVFSLKSKHRYCFVDTEEDTKEDKEKKRALLQSELQKFQKQGFSFDKIFLPTEAPFSLSCGIEFQDTQQENRLHTLCADTDVLVLEKYKPFVQKLAARIDLSVYVVEIEEMYAHLKEMADETSVFGKKVSYLQSFFPCYELVLLGVEKLLTQEEKDIFLKEKRLPVVEQEKLQCIERHFDASVRWIEIAESFERF